MRATAFSGGWLQVSPKPGYFKVLLSFFAEIR